MRGTPFLDSLVVTPPSGDEPAPEPTTTTDSPLFDLDTSELCLLLMSHWRMPRSLRSSQRSTATLNIRREDQRRRGARVHRHGRTQHRGLRNAWTTPGMIVKERHRADRGTRRRRDAHGRQPCRGPAPLTTATPMFTRLSTPPTMWSMTSTTSATAPTLPYVLLMAQSDPIDQVIFADYLVVDDADVEAFNTLPTASISTPTWQARRRPTRARHDARRNRPGLHLRHRRQRDDQRARAGKLERRRQRGLGPGRRSHRVSRSAWRPTCRTSTIGGTRRASSSACRKMCRRLHPDEVLDVFEFSDDCTYDDRYDYEPTRWRAATMYGWTAVRRGQHVRGARRQPGGREFRPSSCCIPCCRPKQDHSSSANWSTRWALPARWNHVPGVGAGTTAEQPDRNRGRGSG